MGSNYSKTSQDIVNDVEMNLTNKVNTEFKSQIRGDSAIIQTRDLNFSGLRSENCVWDLSQKADLEATIMSNMEGEIKTDISNEAVNEIIAKMNEKVKQTNKDFNFLQQNVSITTQRVINDFASTLTNVINNTITNRVDFANSILQNDKQDWSNATIICPPRDRTEELQTISPLEIVTNPDITIRQDASLTTKTVNMTKALADNKAYNDAKNNLTAELTKVLDQSNIGLSAWALAIIIIVALLVLGGFGKAILGMFKRGQSKPYEIKNTRTTIFTLILFFIISVVFFILGSLLNQEELQYYKNEIERIETSPVDVYIRWLGGPSIKTGWEAGDVIEKEFQEDGGESDIVLKKGMIVQWRDYNYIVQVKGEAKRSGDILERLKMKRNELEGTRGWFIFAGVLFLIIFLVILMWWIFSGSSSRSSKVSPGTKLPTKTILGRKLSNKKN